LELKNCIEKKTTIQEERKYRYDIKKSSNKILRNSDFSTLSMNYAEKEEQLML